MYVQMYEKIWPIWSDGVEASLSGTTSEVGGYKGHRRGDGINKRGASPCNSPSAPPHCPPFSQEPTAVPYPTASGACSSLTIQEVSIIISFSLDIC